MTTTPAREAIRDEALEEAARVAEQWRSSLRPGTEARLFGHQDAARNIAAAVRALKSPTKDAPEMVLVPREPTFDQLKAGCDALDRGGAVITAIYCAMLAAAASHIDPPTSQG